MQIDLCQHCKNYLGNLSCTAFMDRIPDEILQGENDHSKPLEGQGNDIVFSEKTSANDIPELPEPDKI